MSVEKVLKEMIVELSKREIDVSCITESTDLISDLDFDSINVVQLIVNIERMFDIEFDDNVLAFDAIINFKTLAECVERQINGEISNECG